MDASLCKRNLSKLREHINCINMFIGIVFFSSSNSVERVMGSEAVWLSVHQDVFVCPWLLSITAAAKGTGIGFGARREFPGDYPPKWNLYSVVIVFEITNHYEKLHFLFPRTSNTYSCSE